MNPGAEGCTFDRSGNSGTVRTIGISGSILSFIFVPVIENYFALFFRADYKLFEMPLILGFSVDARGYGLQGPRFLE